MLQELGRLAERGDAVTIMVDPTPEDEDDEPEQVPVTLTVERVEGRRIDRVTMTAEPPAPLSESPRPISSRAEARR